MSIWLDIVFKFLDGSSDKSNRLLDEQMRAVEKIDEVMEDARQDSEEIIEEAKALDRSLEMNIIDTLSMSYDESQGLTSRPIDIRKKYFSYKISLQVDCGTTDDESEDFEPTILTVESIKIYPKIIVPSPWATIIGFRLESTKKASEIIDGLGLELNSNSKIFITDERHRYYYPTSTDLMGVVLPDHPRTGIIAFQPFLEPIGKFEIHLPPVHTVFSGIQDLSFKYGSPILRSKLSERDMRSKLSERVSQHFKQELPKLEKEAERAKKCGTGITFWAWAGIIMIILWVFLT